MSDVAAQTTDWLWPGRLPLGELSLFAGIQGIGKSMVALDLAARISTGAAWPDGAGPAPRGRTILVSTEDSPEKTIKPRLDAAGADPSRIARVKAVSVGLAAHERRTAFSVDLDTGPLETTIGNLGDVRLVILDPLSSMLAGRDRNKEEDVREALERLAGMAQRTGVTVLGIAHIGKASRDHVLHKVLGSVAFTAVPRAVWMMNKNRECPDLVDMTAGKMNVGKPAAAAWFRTADAAPRIEWLEGGPGITADQSFAPQQGIGRPPNQLQAAKAFLRERVAQGVARWVNDLEEDATAAGLSWTTVKRAYRELGMDHKKGVRAGRQAEFWRRAGDLSRPDDDESPTRGRARPARTAPSASGAHGHP